MYNAFGKRSGHLFGGDKNLIEYLQDQFSEYELEHLSFLNNGAFFKNANIETLSETINFIELVVLLKQNNQ